MRATGSIVRSALLCQGDLASDRIERVMVFVVSLHGVGRGTGIMVATSFLKYSHPADQDDDDRTDSTEFMVCNPEPFLFTVRDTASDLRPAFERWLTQGFSAALRRWGESVIDLV